MMRKHKCAMTGGATGVNFLAQIPNNIKKRKKKRVTGIINRISYEAVHTLTANSPYIRLHGVKFYISCAFEPEAFYLLESQVGESANIEKSNITKSKSLSTIMGLQLMHSLTSIHKPLMCNVCAPLLPTCRKYHQKSAKITSVTKLGNFFLCLK